MPSVCIYATFKAQSSGSAILLRSLDLWCVFVIVHPLYPGTVMKEATMYVELLLSRMSKSKQFQCDLCTPYPLCYCIEVIPVLSPCFCHPYIHLFLIRRVVHISRSVSLLQIAISSLILCVQLFRPFCEIMS